MLPCFVLTFGAALLSSAVGAPLHGRTSNAPIATASAQREVRALRDALLSLSATVSPHEASRAAVRAHETARDLRREYGVVGPPQFHNFLVNAGIRKRGLCHQWTRDLMAELGELKLNTLELHWGIARAGTLREHNSVVVTAKHQPFATGIVLDPWRHSGRLHVGLVAGDRYPWSEDVRDCLCERNRQRRRTAARLISVAAPRQLARTVHPPR